MFRLMLSGNVAKKSFDGLTTQFARNMTTFQTQTNTENSRPRPENLEVTICGLINRDIRISQKGFITLSVQTNTDNENNFVIHRVLVSRQNMVNNLVDRLSNGQRVYIDGTLRYFDFIGMDEKRRSTALILPFRVHICEQYSDDSENKLTSLLDINEVKLFGRVTNQAQHSESSTFLNVATYFFDRNEQQYQPNHHQLMIQNNDEMRDLVCKIPVGSKIYVHGSMKSFSQEANDGKRKFIYFIKPNKLVLSQKHRDEGEQHESAPENL